MIKFIKGDKYTYEGTVDARIYTYAGESYSQGVGIFKDCFSESTSYHLRYTSMIQHTKAEPQYPNPPLPHCKERIAHARGANIESSITNNGPWCFVADPEWQPHLKYQVKAEKTKDDLRIEELERLIRISENCIKKRKEELAELKPTVHY
jgi:hypothetical protein